MNWFFRTPRFAKLPAFLAFCLLLMLSRDALARALPWIHGFADLTLVQNRIEDEGRKDSFRQNYNLYTEFTLARYMRLRLAYRYFKFDLAQQQSENVFTEERQPSLDFTWNHPLFTFASTARHRASKGSSLNSNLTHDDLSFALSSRDTRYPLLRTRYDWQHVHDDLDEDFKDIRDRRLLLDANWDLRKNSFHYTFSHRESENVITDLNSSTDDHLLRWRGHTEAEGGRTRLNSNYSFSYTSIRDEVVGGGHVLQAVPLSAGLYAEDPNPTQGTLQEVDSLIDGDRQTPTSPQIDIGGSTTGRNIGADLGVARPVVAVYVYADRPSGFGPQWTVYSSDDNFNWQQTDAIQSSRYNLALQRYELEFDALTARYVKVVKDGLAPVVPLLVTEIEVLEELPDTGEDSRLRRVHTFDLRVDRDMNEKLMTGADLNLRRELGRDNLGNRDVLDYTLRGSYKSSESLTHSLRWSQSFQDFSGERQSLRDDFAGYALIYRPLPELRSSLSANARDSHEGGELAQRFLGVFADANGSLFPALNVGGGLGFNSTDNKLTGQRSDAFRVTSSFNGAATSFLRLNAGWTWQHIVEKPAENRRNRTVYTLGFDLRPTRTIFARGHLNAIRDVNESIRQDYLLGWNLFPKLSAIAQAYLDRGRDSNRSERYTVNLTYKLGRRGSLYLRYSRLDFSQAYGNDSWALEQGFRLSL